MAVDILILEIAIKLLIDLDVELVLGREDDGKLLLADLGVVGGLLHALLGQTLRTDNLGLGIGLVPFRDKDVVLDVRRNDVFHSASELGQLGLDVVGHGDRREDGERTRGEFHCNVELATLCVYKVASDRPPCTPHAMRMRARAATMSYSAVSL